MKRKNLFIGLIFALGLVGCNNNQTSKDKIDTTVGCDGITTTWIKYDTPVDGYDLLMHCKQEEVGGSYFLTDFHLSKDGKTLSFQQTICFDLWDPCCLEGLTEKDTQYIHNTHITSVTQKLDWHNLLYFEDMDFDGEMELVVCGFVRPQRGYGDCLDCESFTIYKIGDTGISRVRNLPFDEMEEGRCRTVFSFDQKTKCLSLTSYGGVFLEIEEKYWFKNGKPYAMDFNILDKDKGNLYHHWNIDGVESGEIIRRMDSIKKQGNYD